MCVCDDLRAVPILATTLIVLLIVCEPGFTRKPWKDPLSRGLPRGYIFGRFECIDGWEGNLNANGSFTSCHLRVKVPSWFEKNTIIIIIVVSVILFVCFVIYLLVRRKLRQRYLLAKAERRRSRRSSEEEKKA